jgi:hypothetical protein
MMISGMFLFLSIIIVSLLSFFFKIDDFYKNNVLFYYIISNFITFLLIYFVYIGKFSFIVGVIYPMILINMILPLSFLEKYNDDNS